ncbi:Annexin-B11 [Toxocara canis]|uniref:Annexin-B11 n=1 Tax=Toxocara canis TaxID=6265 RepID=A0A0B2VHS2_TOXCA|nr:Annexin-B11 [Toxocara canis]
MSSIQEAHLFRYGLLLKEIRYNRIDLKYSQCIPKVIAESVIASTTSVPMYYAIFKDAHKLLADGEKKLGTDDSTFNSILVTQNFNQLKKVFVEYEKITGHGFEKAIEKEFSGDTKKGFLAIIQCIESKPKYFAKQLYDSMKVVSILRMKLTGLGTRDNDLIRVIISRSEIDLALIREEFEVMYKKPLIDFIRSDCSGAYRDSLISIVKGN